MEKALLTLVAGFCVFIFGMNTASSNLQQFAGNKMRDYLNSLSKNKFLGIILGIFVTFLFQSSSATTLMLIGLVDANLINVTQAMTVILGAAVGTTFTVQAISFKLADYCFILIILGFVIPYINKKKNYKFFGNIFLGFGFLFLGLSIMITATYDIKNIAWFVQSKHFFSNHFFLTLLISFVFTALIHSSAATIAFTISLASADMITLKDAMPWILGANIGTCATAIMGSWFTSYKGRRVAFAYLLFKLMGTLLIIPILSFFEMLVLKTSSTLTHQIANAHTLFSFFNMLVFFPFINAGVWFIQKIVPEEKGVEKFKPNYLDKGAIQTPALAFANATRELLRMADIVMLMLNNALAVFKYGNERLIEEIESNDDKVDLLNKEIKLYLVRISQSELSEEHSKKEFHLIGFANNLEIIGDTIEKHLMKLAIKKINKGVNFSKIGFEEIVTFHTMVTENLDYVISSFASQNHDLSKKVITREDTIKLTFERFRNAHIMRLQKGMPESIETTSLHIDILSSLLTINLYVTNTANLLLQQNISNGNNHQKPNIYETYE